MHNTKDRTALFIALALLFAAPVIGLGQVCEYLSLVKHPAYLIPGRGVVLVDNLIGKRGTGFVVGNPYNFHKQCATSETCSIYILTAAHILDKNDDKKITPDEIRYYEEESGYLQFNYLETEIVTKISGVKVVQYPKIPGCFNYAGVPVYEDFAVIRADMPRDLLNAISPWYFGMDYQPDWHASYVNVHHPQGLTKKISFVDHINPTNQPEACFHCIVTYAKGPVDRGASGSPIFRDMRPWNVALMPIVGVGACPMLSYAVNLGFTRDNHFLDVIYGPETAGMAKIDGYSHGAVTFAGLYSGKETTIASGSALNINRTNPLGIIVNNGARLFLGAPEVNLNGFPPTGNLRVFNHSNVQISAGLLNVPSLQVAPTYPPGSEGYDGSSIDIKACESKPVENWIFGQDAVANVVIANSELHLGLPLSASSQPALQLAPATRVTLQALDIVVHQPITTTGWMIPWDEGAYLKLISANRILINPDNLMEIDIDLASQAVLASTNIMIQNANIALAGAAWRVSGQNVSAHDMHLIRDIVQDWQVEDGIVWYAPKMDFTKTIIQNNAVGNVKFVGTDMMWKNSSVMIPNNNAGFTLNAYRAGMVNFQLIYGQPSQPSLNFLMPAGQINNATIHTLPVITPNQMQQSVASASKTATGPLTFTLKASSISGDINLVATNNLVTVETGSWTLTPKGGLNTGKTGRITFKAMSKTELASYNSEFESRMTTAMASVKTEMAALLGTDGDAATRTDLSSDAQAANLAAATAAVEEVEAVTLPDHYALAAFPNPFNARTTIRLDLPEESEVEVVIYNVRGERIAVLHDGRLSGGSHNLSWEGSQSASGMYFCIMSGHSTRSAISIYKKIKLTSLK